jgi:hypothetical protein
MRTARESPTDTRYTYAHIKKQGKLHVAIIQFTALAPEMVHTRALFIALSDTLQIRALISLSPLSC